jgi:hypothetical protein|tara:strand:+ start:172 stop:378 length:207 start_codon:yes stop_codon:yes gene_type:complete
MKAPIPMPADEILFAEMSKSALNNSQMPQNNPGSNPWLKYLIVGGLIVISGVIAYHLTKPKKDDERYY